MFRQLNTLIKHPPITLENMIPLGLITVFGTLAIRSPMWTFISFLLLVISLHVIYKRIRKKCSSFYFSFTICSLVGAHLVYELIGTPVMRITYLEYTTNIGLFTLTLYLIYRTKIAINQPPPSSGLLATQPPPQLTPNKPPYDYCRRCQTTIPNRDHHCVWLNVCIGKCNKYWFLGCLTVGACWIGLITNIFLNSVCYPVSIFSTSLFSSSSVVGGSHHYGLVPVSCPEAYVKTDVTIGFVTSIYGLIVLLFVLAVLIHQLSLLYRGVSYIELKYSKKQVSRGSNKPVSSTSSSAVSTE